MESDVLTLDEIPLTESNCNDSSVIKEGKAEILLSISNKVFYNPVQEFNRDLSIAVLKVFAQDFRDNSKEKWKDKEIKSERSFESPPPKGGEQLEEGISILEALSASGLRSIRYAKEITGVRTVVANDISAKAVESIKRNIIHNGVENLVKTSHSDASILMYSHRRPLTERFSAIDLDPYGCPSIFLDAAVQCVADGGLLLVTATDMAILAGNSPETCHTKYGSISLRSRACHEMALRILLYCIESHANRYGRYIVPLLSVSVDFYIRVFVKIFTGQAVCKRSTSKLSLVYQCTGCDSFTLQPLGICRQVDKQTKYSLPTGPPVGKTCDHCGHKHHVGGPIWSAPIHDAPFLERLANLISDSEEFPKYGTGLRMEGLLAVLKEELLDVPLYYTLDRLCSIIHSETMPMVTFRSALLNAGYRVSLSHACRTSVKTDAPTEFIWNIMRAWEESHPVKRERIPPTSPGHALLSKVKVDESMQNLNDFPVVNFNPHPEANPPSRKRGLVRFQENPLPHWGPGTRATAMTAGNRSQKKRQRNQGKRSQTGNISESSRKMMKAE